LSAFAVVVLGALVSGCWSQQGFDAGRTYWKPGESAINRGNVDDVVLAWDTALPGGSNVNGPLSSDGVFVTSGGTKVVALDPGTGAERWTRDLSTPGGQQVSAPLWEQGALLVPVNTAAPLPSFPGSGTVLKLDVVDGSTISSGPSVSGAVFDLATQDDVLARTTRGLFGHLGSGRYATVEWTFRPVLAWATSGGVPAGDYTIVGPRVLWSQGNQALGFSPTCPAPPPGTPADGCAPDWQTVLPGTPIRPAALRGNRVVYGDGSGRVSVVRTLAGSVQWTGETGSPIVGNIVVADGVVLVTTADQRLVAFPADGCGAATCAASWEAPISSGTPRAAAAGDVVYVAAGNEIRAFSIRGCGAPTCATPLTTLATDSAVTGGPIVDDGRIIVGTAGGHVTAWALPS
jgi:outer membrane protein assembly factor BamB